MSRIGRGGEGDDGERGDAVVEFIGLIAVFVIPMFYFVVALAAVQAGVFASEAGAREAARVLADDPDDMATATAQVGLAFADFGVDSQPEVSTACSVCSGSGRDVRVTVSTRVPLPFLPSWAGDFASVPVTSSSATLVDEVGVDEP